MGRGDNQPGRECGASWQGPFDFRNNTSLIQKYVFVEKGHVISENQECPTTTSALEVTSTHSQSSSFFFIPFYIKI